jgi:Family of unknown function (DUF6365)
MPPQPNKIFDMTLTAADLLISLNFSATTVIKAMICNVPIVFIPNRYRANTSQELEALIPKVPSSKLQGWISDCAPIFPFSVWPLGFENITTSIATENPFSDTMAHVELLHEKEVIDLMSSLLFDVTAIAALNEKQIAYSNLLSKLPRPADVLRDLLKQ